MPLIGTRGAASAQGFGEFAQQTAANYIEDVFSTYLYTGNGSSQTIANGIDLTTYGGMVWIKDRTNAYNHVLTDTVRGATSQLYSNLTNAATTSSVYLSAFTSSGFSVGNSAPTNTSSANDVSWTFRKQPKFFDIVTYTGNGVSGRQISHSLGSTPGFMIIKRTDDAYSWACWHRSLSTSTSYLTLNNTNQAFNDPTVFNAAPTSTYFQVGADAWVNANGGSYVAYLFAHNAGGFGTAGTDNVISCGSVTTDSVTGIGTVSLGYEPQWVLYKRTDNAGNWNLLDNMRGWYATTQSGATLFANSAFDEASLGGQGSPASYPNATGFTINASGAQTFIYIAIRRGPMKTPTTGTSVFNVVSRTGNGTSGAVVDAGFPVDLAFVKRNTAGFNGAWEDRLRGNNTFLSPNATDQQYNGGNTVRFTTNQNGVSLGTDSWVNASSQTYFNFFFRRAAGFFDEVCWSYGTFPTYHNLGVVPEMIIQKRTDAAGNWAVFTSNSYVNALALNLTDSYSGWGGGIDWSATSTTFNVTSVAGAGNHVAYLFASCPGVSKVGSYTGTGGTQTISCGFAARWVMIKRTDSTGNWWYWDTTRGMVSGTDPRLAMNTNDAQTNADWVYTNASGFQIVTTDATVNASGGSYIYLAIA